MDKKGSNEAENTDRDDLEHVAGWGERIKDYIHRTNQDGLGVIESFCKGVVKALPLSYLALHYTREEPLRVLGASPVFLQEFHYSSPEELTFDTLFRVPPDLVDIENVKRALKNPLHMQFSIPLFDGEHNESLVYVSKREISTRDVSLSYFSKREQRHYFLLLEINRVGYVQRSRDRNFRSCKYVFLRKTRTPYDCRTKEQAQIAKKANPKRDRPFLWDLLGA